jgi:hypothetical protein
VIFRKEKEQQKREELKFLLMEAFPILLWLNGKNNDSKTMIITA